MSNPNINRKKARLYNSRNIRAQSTDPSLDSKEKLSVPTFLASRQFEIKSFELSQLNSKNALSTRIFQSLPRSLRRRAASHNVKRIPKRLRVRAVREMSATGPVKRMPKGRQLYKIQSAKRLLRVAGRLKSMKQIPEFKSVNIRQQYKLLSKQLKELVENKKLPQVNNAVGSRDVVGINKLTNAPSGNIKYFKRQRDFVWLPTHIWHAKRFKMIKNHGYQIPHTPTQKCFKSMSRQGKTKAIAFDTSYYGTMIINIPDKQSYKNVLHDLIRTKSTKVVNGEKSYYGWIYMNSQQIYQGYVYSSLANGQIIIRVFPSVYKKLFKHFKENVNCTIQDCRFALGSIELTGPAALSSLSKMLHLHDSKTIEIWKQLTSVQDTDLIPIGTTFTFDSQDPRIFKSFKMYKSDTTNIYDVIISLQSTQLVDPSIVNQICQSESRNNSYKDQLTNKDIGKFHANLTSQPKDISKSHIPALVSKLARQKWMIILPWHWILPFWLTLAKIRDVKPGGIQQIYQLNFENGVGSFPQDFPWLEDGWIYNDINGQANLFKASKLPKSQVTLAAAESKVSDVFDAYKCDWHSLRNITYIQKLKNLPEKLESKTNYASFEGLERNITSTHDLIQVVRSLKEEIVDSEPVIELYDETNPNHKQFHDNSSTIESIPAIVRSKLPVRQVRVTLIGEGTISNNARVYSDKDACDVNVIGFVTSGGMNLRQGAFTGIGAIVAQEFSSQIYIRNVGQTKLYLGKLELV
ncbi:uncharacterized protein SPAPADRAFT_70471 [Spathaspora passalidarum NRRL Y-27907]|uniref:Uncharacterized protein n=1 Tax=Spathaspora passalidarum (strain NRRL Y-27907 / 11-Y1) TaxID=619300 RepID=G3AI29_SPAPN|nr:uncharacterized protein SPAPADRAFT_70471 [Spathaspora passalidarum NRRL Y-27907]EGW34343.1 hypothetical protein SPAPADRAFT_70471 [Spathaspora passalidarum NRRL Y-27907]